MTELNTVNTLKTCLITGGNGYLGRHIYEHLSGLNFRISTLGRGLNNTHVHDLSLEIPVFDTNFEVIVHCAGKAHSFPTNPQEKLAFFDVNVKGTKNLLKALEAAPKLPNCFVFMSSVSVYGLNKGLEIVEDQPLQSQHPYGKSKIEAETVIESWCKEHSVKCLILRLPLLAGKNPPGNLKMMIEGIRKGYYFNISRESVRKSIVMAEDVAKIIPESLEIGGIYNLTDGQHPSFKELADLIADQLGKPKPKSLPTWLGSTLSFLGNKFSFLSPINAYKLDKLTSSLTFDDNKARTKLNWNPQPVLKRFRID